MIQKVISLRCKNYEKHMIEIEEHPDRQSASLFIRDDMAVTYGWKRVDGRWLCSACLGELTE